MNFVLSRAVLRFKGRVDIFFCFSLNALSEFWIHQRGEMFCDLEAAIQSLSVAQI